jgi:hypothetical protein
MTMIDLDEVDESIANITKALRLAEENGFDDFVDGIYDEIKAVTIPLLNTLWEIALTPEDKLALRRRAAMLGTMLRLRPIHRRRAS